ncbi:PAS domain-containing sensor histidine kinase [Methanolobus zinderi]|uniref:histidine kinase n=1 Tax=Methanolobus zinderi TaxID=536044 RepID=A0A7D5ICH0_9EURY|nr:PAS domain-containing sensor histidine kinase [Methanolobus zinderi]QLC50729.1 PAS domain-containing sensor histidine kinase [Methanolobus zinderi]
MESHNKNQDLSELTEQNCSLEIDPDLVFTGNLSSEEVRSAKPFLDLVNGFILLIDNEHNIVSINKKASSLSGYAAQDVENKSWLDIFVPANLQDKLKADFSSVSCDETSSQDSFECLVQCRDGTELNMDLKVTILQDGDGSTSGFLLIGSDIVQKKKVIRENTKLLSFLGAATYAVIFSDSSGHITFWNKAAAELFGYEEEEALGQPLTIIMPKRYRKAHEGWDQIISIGKSPVVGRIFEVTGLRKDGSEFPVEISINTTHVKGEVFHGAFLNDISKRKMKERLMTISKNKYRMMFEKSPLGIFHFDENGVITQCNENFVKIVGAPEENVISSIMGFNMLRSFRDRSIKKAIRQVLAGIPARYEDNFHSPFSSKVIPIKAEFSPVISEEGKLMGGVCVVEDFTERKAAEEALNTYADELSKANEELKSLDRMKDEFLSNLRHELTTPLIPIKGYSELMFDGALGDLNERQHDAMEKIMLSSERLKRLIDSLLYVSITEGGNVDYTFIPLRLTEVLESAINDRSPEITSKGHTIEKDLPCDLPLIEGDLDYLRNVFVNLIDNSVKFTPDKGIIKISASNEDDHAHLQIADNGIGIGDTEILNIFNRFYQVDGSSTRKYGGNGLGLYICKKIIEAHKGEIWAESRQGEGTTIHVTLPFKQKSMEDQPSPEMQE